MLSHFPLSAPLVQSLLDNFILEPHLQFGMSASISLYFVVCSHELGPIYNMGSLINCNVANIKFSHPFH